MNVEKTARQHPCPECGSAVDTGWSSCPQCGCPLPPPGTVPPSTALPTAPIAGTPAWLGIGGFILTWYLLTWLTCSLLSWLQTPSLDGNLEAYILLNNAFESGEWPCIVSACRKAHSIADDPDLRQIADFVARVGELQIRMGWNTFEESSSFSAGLEGFVAGFLNPLLGIEGVGMMIEMFTTDFEAIGSRVDSRYEPLVEARRNVPLLWRWLFWIFFLGGVVAIVFCRKQALQWVGLAVTRVSTKDW